MPKQPLQSSPLHQEIAEKFFDGTLDEDEMFEIWVREQSNMLLTLPDGERKNKLFMSLSREEKILLFAEKPNSWENFQIMIYTAIEEFLKILVALTPPDQN